MVRQAPPNQAYKNDVIDGRQQSMGFSSALYTRSLFQPPILAGLAVGMHAVEVVVAVVVCMVWMHMDAEFAAWFLIERACEAEG